MSEAYWSALETAEKWGVSLRQIQRLCARGHIPGAKKLGHNWIIPSDAELPRTGWDVGEKPCPLPDGVPNIFMSGFYSTPGTADALKGALNGDEAKALYSAQLAYYRGQTELSESIVQQLLEGETCFETQVGCALLLAICSLYSGRVTGWQRAMALFQSLEARRPDSVALRVSKASLNGVLYVEDAPDWLKRGSFSDFPPSAHPAQAYLYAKWLFTRKNYSSLAAASGPLIALVKNAGALLPELYLHLLTCAALQRLGDDEAAGEHLRLALALALPDRLFGVLAEHRRQLGAALDDALKAEDSSLVPQVMELYDKLSVGFTTLHNAVTGRELSSELTLREHEMAELAQSGLSNAELARRLGISESSVKKYLNTLYSKLNISSRKELKKYIL